MRVLFVHQNYPAQFGHLARYLEQKLGWQTLFATKWEGTRGYTPLLKYTPQTASSKSAAFSARNYQNCIGQALGVYQALRQMPRPHFRPDIIVSHSGFGSSGFLRDLFDCPVVCLFEFFYRVKSLYQEHDVYCPEEEYQRRLYFLNAMILADLHDAASGYTPTHFQRNQFPIEYLPKIETLFDGIDRSVFHPRTVSRTFRGRTIPESTRIVTYVSRGFESMRGFDVFIRAAKRIYERHPDVLFICAGSDRVVYGGDLRRIEEKSFREHVFNNERPDESKFWFTGMVNTQELVHLLNLGDAHMYFTRPFVLSWSLFNALSCGARIVSSATEPVMEVVTHRHNGLLAPFHDHEAHAEHVLELFRDPDLGARLSASAADTVQRKYSMQQCFPRFVRLLERVAAR